MEILQWICLVSLLAVFYTYLGYPLVLALRKLIWTRKIDKKEDYRPSVTVILPLYNEADVAKEKLENLLSMDYPSDKFEVVVGSDGSSDGTNEIVAEFTDPRIRFFPFEERRGKSGMLHDLIPRAQGDILVFTDADEMFETDAVIKLVRNFHDSKVGGVSGQEVYPAKEGAIEGGTSLYWRYEYFLYKMESDIWSIHSCPGPIYAIRKELFIPYPGYLINDDDIIPLQVALQKYRVVYEPEARASADSLGNVHEEAVRRIRFQAGQFQIFLYKWYAGIPFISPVGFSYFSHRILRSLSVFFLFALFFCNIPLWNESPFHYLLYAQFVFYGLALLGHLLLKIGIRSSLLAVPLMFCIHNYASLMGLWGIITGKQTSRWTQVTV